MESLKFVIRSTTTPSTGGGGTQKELDYLVADSKLITQITLCNTEGLRLGFQHVGGYYDTELGFDGPNAYSSATGFKATGVWVAYTTPDDVVGTPIGIVDYTARYLGNGDYEYVSAVNSEIESWLTQCTLLLRADGFTMMTNFDIVYSTPPYVLGTLMWVDTYVWMYSDPGNNLVANADERQSFPDGTMFNGSDYSGWRYTDLNWGFTLFWTSKILCEELP